MTREDTAAHRERASDERRAYSRRFHNLYLFVTERCQLRCGHCYMGERLARGLELTYEQAAGSIRYMYRLGAEYLTFVGGEPLLHRDLPALVRLALSTGYKKVMVDTNGLLIDRITDIPSDALYYVRVSLDGTAASHNRVRGLDSFAKTVTGIQKLVKLGYQVRITTTLFEFNLHEVKAVVAMARDLGVNVVNLHNFSPEGSGAANSSWAVSPKKWVDFCDDLEQSKSPKGMEIRYPPTWSPRNKIDYYVTKGFRGCLGSSLDRVSIFPDGRCYICSLLFDQNIHFAVIGPYGLKINRGPNEFEEFCRARLASSDASLMGCPADMTSPSKANEGGDGLVSMCRLWRTVV